MRYKQISTTLIVDLDGTLIATDSLVESAILLLKNNPFYFFYMLLWLFNSRASLKKEIALRTALDIKSLPYSVSFLEWLKDEKRRGRRIYLATAAHETIAAKVFHHVDIFDGFFASDETRNLKGDTKLEVIKEEVGSDFVYAGNSHADLPIWRAAKAVVMVNAPSRLANQVRSELPVEIEFPPKKIGIKTWLHALRVHQWVKNTLLFVPLLTAFEFMDMYKFSSVLCAFLSYSLVASGTYLLNDIWDLRFDRLHPRKCHRPLANGSIPIINGLAMVVFLFSIALGIALFISKTFVAMLVIYFILTSAYSLVFKHHLFVDIIILSSLYTLRIITGVIVIQVTVSSWLLTFSMFLFLSLALIKRCGELVSIEKNSATAVISGRDYSPNDLVVLWPLGVGASMAAIVVFGLFINAPETQLRYASPELLWAVAIGLMYWLGRIWIKTSRGEMHDDPIVYVIKDSISYFLLLSITVITMVAYFFNLPILCGV